MTSVSGLRAVERFVARGQDYPDGTPVGRYSRTPRRREVIAGIGFEDVVKKPPQGAASVPRRDTVVVGQSG